MATRVGRRFDLEIVVIPAPMLRGFEMMLDVVVVAEAAMFGAGVVEGVAMHGMDIACIDHAVLKKGDQGQDIAAEEPRYEYQDACNRIDEAYGGNEGIPDGHAADELAQLPALFAPPQIGNDSVARDEVQPLPECMAGKIAEARAVVGHGRLRIAGAVFLDVVNVDVLDTVVVGDACGQDAQHVVEIDLAGLHNALRRRGGAGLGIENAIVNVDVVGDFVGKLTEQEQRAVAQNDEVVAGAWYDQQDDQRQYDNGIADPDAGEDRIDGIGQHACKPAIEPADSNSLADTRERVGDFGVCKIGAGNEPDGEPDSHLAEDVFEMGIIGKERVEGLRQAGECQRRPAQPDQRMAL